MPSSGLCSAVAGLSRGAPYATKMSARHGVIDVSFDVRSDTPPGRDPDSHSTTLKRYHQLLWSKPLPDGRRLSLSETTPDVYLHHSSPEVGELFLGSDTIFTSHVGRLNHLYRQLPDSVNEDFLRRGFTIGGSIVFPGNRIGRRQTINQARGMHPLIQDRFDLTLECIRRHYAGESSPLGEAIGRHASFFELFGSFTGYVDFFHLQDLVNADGTIGFLHDFDDFRGPALPQDLPAYVRYREATLVFVTARNRRIAVSPEDMADASAPR